jgi:hypothetical protein
MVAHYVFFAYYTGKWDREFNKDEPMAFPDQHEGLKN